ncbi:MAG: hypothetical protein JOZ25_10965 [Actinobacteria bacterium]|nr:hypothetical protein [Actinomycetota bacterium]
MSPVAAQNRGPRGEGRAVVVLAALLLAVALAVYVPASQAAHQSRPLRESATGSKKHHHHHPRVLRVGSWKGIKGQFRSIQAAVDAARPGDWILVGPGDYHERADHRKKAARRGPQPSHTPAAVIIAKPRIHLRGMNRRKVVVDGTKPGSPRCSSNQKNQDLGPKDSNGDRLGRNGILVWKSNRVSVDNLSACNFLSGSGSTGNEIWWNGGDGGGKINLHNFEGRYLTATSTFYGDGTNAASYGIFSSDASGGSWSHMYASNMSDSNYYVGACQQVCNQVVDHVWSEYSSQGYSGTNAGGKVVIKHSEFDNNQSGFTAGALNNDDWPSPQEGACPGGNTSPITHTYSFWVFMDNYVHDNNNPNVLGVGIAAVAPVGTGLLLYGGRDDTVMHNRFSNNGAWAVVFLTYPDTETPPDDVIAAGDDCRGGVNAGPPSNACVYDDWGNAVLYNTFHNNGWFKQMASPTGNNSSNADIGEITSTSGPTNCYHYDVEQGGGTVTTSPAGLEQSKPVCDRHTVPANGNLVMTNDVICDSQAFAGLAPGVNSTPCQPGSYYPRKTTVVMHPVPRHLASMPNPCKGVPANPWCPRRDKD